MFVVNGDKIRRIHATMFVAIIMLLEALNGLVRGFLKYRSELKQRDHLLDHCFEPTMHLLTLDVAGILRILFLQSCEGLLFRILLRNPLTVDCLMSLCSRVKS